MEDELLAGARRGDPEAFERLVGLHSDSVYGVVAGHLGSGPDAEDAAQEVFVRLHQGLGGFRGDARISTWLYRVATNVALTRAKRRGRTRAFGLDAVAESAARDLAPDQVLAGGERDDAVRRAVRELPEDQRAVVVLRAFEGLPFDEVARVLGILRPTAESRMARAKERLKEKLGKWLG